MCGLWGVVSKVKQGLFQSDMDEIQQMMLDTVQRGDHSTGLFITDYQSPTDAPTGVKCVGGPHNIIYGPIWKELTEYIGRRGGAVIGHGRHATRGKISVKNAHPFQHEDITLVHNGTIYGGLSFAKKGDTEIEVDSHALCVAMHERGVAEALTDIHGAYAIIAHDATDGYLYIARNKERPLFWYPARDRIYIMSEFQYLRALVHRYNKEVEPNNIHIFEENILYRIDLDDPTDIVRVQDLQELRNAKEAEKRKREEEERQKRAAEFRSRPGYSGDRYTPPVTTPASQAKKRTEIIFEVKSIEPGRGGNYKYWCLGADKEKVYFETDTRREEYIGRIGEAKPNKIHWKDGKATFFVKHRSIEWDREPEVEESPIEGGYFLLANKKRMLVSDWHKRLTHEGCDVCDHNFSFNEYKDTWLTDDDKLVCRECQSLFHLQQMRTQAAANEEIPINTMH
jgi:hypothetical protein